MGITNGTVPRPNLLLLPATPWPISYDSIKAAYETPIRHTLRHLKSVIDQGEKLTNLTIAVHAPFLYSNRKEPRRKLYGPVQELVAGVYTLVCLIAAQDSISLEREWGIDVCVVIISWPRTRSAFEKPLPTEQGLELIGPVISLPVFGECDRLLDNQFEVEDNGNESLKDYRDYLQDYRDIQRIVPQKTVKVPAGHVHVRAGEHESAVAGNSDKGAPEQNLRDYYYSIAVGGTFDHLHIGHKLLLTMLAYLLGPEPPETAPTIDKKSAEDKQLIIGITGDELLKNKSNQNLIESWPVRQKAVWIFLQRIMNFTSTRIRGPTSSDNPTPGPNGYHITETLGGVTLNFAEIRDPFGPTITNQSITALVVSAETRKGGHAVNMKRAEKGWSALDVYEVDVLSAEEAEEGKVDAVSYTHLTLPTKRIV